MRTNLALPVLGVALVAAGAIVVTVVRKPAPVPAGPTAIPSATDAQLVDRLRSQGF